MIIQYLLKAFYLILWFVKESLRTFFYCSLIFSLYLVRNSKYLIMIYLLYKLGISNNSFLYFIYYAFSDLVLIEYFFDLEKLIRFFWFHTLFPIIVEPYLFSDNVGYLFSQELSTISASLDYINILYEFLFHDPYVLWLPYIDVYLYIPNPNLQWLIETKNPFVINIYIFFALKWLKYQSVVFLVWCQKTPFLFFSCQQHFIVVYIYYFIQIIKYVVILSVLYTI